MDYIKKSKDLVKLGIMGNVAGATFGAMGSIPGMPAEASQASSLAMKGVNLAAVGGLASTGMGLVEDIANKGSKISSPLGKIKNRERINKILY